MVVLVTMAEGKTVNKSSSFCNIEFQTHHSIPRHKRSLLCFLYQITWQLCHNLCEASERSLSPATLPLLFSLTAYLFLMYISYVAEREKKNPFVCQNNPCLSSPHISFE